MSKSLLLVSGRHLYRPSRLAFAQQSDRLPRLLAYRNCSPLMTESNQRIANSGIKEGVMEFQEKLASLAAKIRQQKSVIQTEEATKNAFVMPFIQSVLGYDDC